MIENNASKRITNVEWFIIFFYIERCFFFKDLEMFFWLKFFYRLQVNSAYNNIYLINISQRANPVETTPVHLPETAHNKTTMQEYIWAEGLKYLMGVRLIPSSLHNTQT